MPSRVLPYLLIALLTACAWANALGNAPVWDDRITIFDNPVVREARWGEILARPTGDYYRPVVFGSFAIAGGTDPDRFAALVAGNVVLHILVASLLFAAVSTFGATRIAALVAAVLFALHPVQTEAVTYVSGRTDLLAALFSLASLLLHARARGWTGGKPRPRFVIGAVACFALALGSKESAALLPIALLAGDRILGRPAERGVAKALAAMLPYAILLAAYTVWRAHLGRGVVAIGSPGELALRLGSALTAACGYARLLLFPVNLHLERFVSAMAALALFGTALLAAVLLAIRRGDGTTRFWILWAAIAYLPGSNLVPIYPGLPAGTIFAPEHFLYLPLTGILAATVPPIAARIPRRPAALALTATLACFALLVHDRNRDWRDEETIYRHTLRFSPESARVRLNLGNLLLARGDAAGAAGQYAEGTRFYPDDVDLLLNLGVAETRLGGIADAERALLRATSLAPNDAPAWAALGALYGNTGRLENARRAYGRALAIDPRNADAKQALSILNQVQK